LEEPAFNRLGRNEIPAQDGKICRVRQAPISGNTKLSSNFKSLAFGPDFAT
jgi:hypothetical protein